MSQFFNLFDQSKRQGHVKVLRSSYKYDCG